MLALIVSSFQLNTKQKTLYADKLIDLAHLTFAGFVVGQFISDRPFSMNLATFGIIAVVVLYWASYVIMRTR